LRTLSDIADKMRVYFGTFTVVNICLRVVTPALTWIVGLPNPLLRGPRGNPQLHFPHYIGVAVVVATLSFVGLLTFLTLGEAAVASLIYLAIAAVEGQFLTSMFMDTD
jgi:predicted PurR-regulated permease PerM